MSAYKRMLDALKGEKHGVAQCSLGNLYSKLLSNITAGFLSLHLDWRSKLAYTALQRSKVELTEIVKTFHLRSSNELVKYPRALHLTIPTHNYHL